jgi:phage shock protein C
MYCWNCAKEMEDAANFCSACGTARPQVHPPREDPYARPSLSRIREGKRIAGVCGGVARYFDLDVTLIRVLWIVLTIFAALLPGMVVYVVCWIAMPQDPLPYVATASTEGAPTFSA